MKSLKIILPFVIFYLFSCNQHYVNSIYPIPSKKLFKQQEYYKNKYGYIGTLSDTIIKDEQLIRTYKGGILNKIGKIDADKPVGHWFIFKDSLNLEYIFRYDINKIDSFYHPFAIVNQSW